MFNYSEIETPPDALIYFINAQLASIRDSLSRTRPPKSHINRHLDMAFDMLMCFEKLNIEHMYLQSVENAFWSTIEKCHEIGVGTRYSLDKNIV